MIYLLVGNDTKKKNLYLKKIVNNDLLITFSSKEISREKIFEQVGSMNFFGESPVVVINNALKDGSLVFSSQDLLFLKKTATVFVFLEDSLTNSILKEYKKYSEIENFDLKTVKSSPKNNIFNLAESFSLRDKIGTWALFQEATYRGVSPEEICGVLFWKIKTMLLNKNKIFTPDELKKRSTELVSLYHRAHNGEVDFNIGLEQFILSSLDKIKK